MDIVLASLILLSPPGVDDHGLVPSLAAVSAQVIVNMMRAMPGRPALSLSLAVAVKSKDIVTGPDDQVKDS